MKATLIIALLLTLSIPSAGAPTTSGRKQERWSGRVQWVDQSRNSVGVAKGRSLKTVVYGNTTAWTKGIDPASQHDLQRETYVVVIGHFDSQGRLIADRIDLRGRATIAPRTGLR
jgi:hypothetical protein